MWGAFKCSSYKQRFLYPREMSFGEQAIVVYIRKSSYSRGLNIRVLISNHEEQLWQEHLLGCSYKRSFFKRGSNKWI